jgi:hypothetical protein
VAEHKKRSEPTALMKWLTSVGAKKVEPSQNLEQDHFGANLVFIDEERMSCCFRRLVANMASLRHKYPGGPNAFVRKHDIRAN